jgi:hypothetical protein
MLVTGFPVGVVASAVHVAVPVFPYSWYVTTFPPVIVIDVSTMGAGIFIITHSPLNVIPFEFVEEYNQLQTVEHTE